MCCFSLSGYRYLYDSGTDRRISVPDKSSPLLGVVPPVDPQIGNFWPAFFCFDREYLKNGKSQCEVSRVRVMLLMSVAYNFFLFTTRPTILLLVYLLLNSINQHQDSDVKCV